jgi:predicted dinucleotide-binding enzyme
VIFLAVPFSSHKEVAKEFDVADAFAEARLVKAFNHLPAAQLGTNPSSPSQRQAIFVSGNDADANATVSTLIAKLGLAPVDLGRVDEGGVPLHVVNGKPGGLLFQNLEKLG